MLTRGGTHVNGIYEVLKGVRIVDFTWSVSGPTATRILASFGAEVIKVEWPESPDPMRFSMYAKGDTPGLDNGAFFNNLNAGKLGITLNVKSERGRVLLHELLKKCDVVVENFSSGVFEKWGLTYEAMCQISPSIIYMSISGLGHTGRDKSYTTWGPTAAALNGMSFMSGLPGVHPCGWGYSIMDVVTGYSAAYSVLAALYHKQRTGNGQQIDVSQVETGLPLVGVPLLDHVVNHRSSIREGFPSGNRAMTGPDYSSPTYRGKIGVPHNTYRCAGGGPNDWCTIAVFSDEEWIQLKSVMGNPKWANHEKFDTIVGRARFQEELDAHIAELTKSCDKYELMLKLQNSGIACGVVQMNEELLDRDPQLRYRGLFEKLEHPQLGIRRFEGVPIKMSKSPPYHHKAAPLMGEDNGYVFGDLLGYGSAEVHELTEEGVLWPVGLTRESMSGVTPLW